MALLAILSFHGGVCTESGSLPHRVQIPTEAPGQWGKLRTQMSKKGGGLVEKVETLVQFEILYALAASFLFLAHPDVSVRKGARDNEWSMKGKVEGRGRESKARGQGREQKLYM